MVRNLVVTVIDSMVTSDNCPSIEGLLGLMEDVRKLRQFDIYCFDSFLEPFVLNCVLQRYNCVD